MRDLIDGPYPEFTAAMMAGEQRRVWLEANIATCRKLLASCGDEDAMAAMSLAGQINDWEDQLTAVLSGDVAKASAEPAGGNFAVGRSMDDNHRARAQRDVFDICKCFNISPSLAADMIEAIDRVEKIYAARSFSATNDQSERE